MSFLLCAFLLVGCASKPVRLTVLTYNIHHAAGVDKRLDIERIARVITDSKADLVALQEVDNGVPRTDNVNQPAELGRLTKMHAFFGKAMDFAGGEYGDVVLSKPTIKSQRVVALPHTAGGEHEPRAAAIARVRVQGKDIIFISTHLDHLGEPSDRLRQMQAIAMALKDEKLPIVLAGDFNCVPDTEPLAVLDTSWLRATDDEPSIPVVNPKHKIDHVFVKPAARWKVIETHVIDQEVASDHRPVVVTLELAR
jgi:endonuclease/exonuclease/phosphatase family metal-dependent hydrolase